MLLNNKKEWIIDMDLKSITLSEKENLSQRLHIVWVHLYNILEITTIEMEKRSVVARGFDWGWWDGVGNIRDYFCGDSTVPYLDLGTGCMNLYLRIKLHRTHTQRLKKLTTELKIWKLTKVCSLVSSHKPMSASWFDVVWQLYKMSTLREAGWRVPGTVLFLHLPISL